MTTILNTLSKMQLPTIRVGGRMVRNVTSLNTNCRVDALSNFTLMYFNQIPMPMYFKYDPRMTVPTHTTKDHYTNLKILLKQSQIEANLTDIDLFTRVQQIEAEYNEAHRQTANNKASTTETKPISLWSLRAANKCKLNTTHCPLSTLEMKSIALGLGPFVLMPEVTLYKDINEHAQAMLETRGQEYRASQVSQDNTENGEIE